MAWAAVKVRRKARHVRATANPVCRAMTSIDGGSVHHQPGGLTRSSRPPGGRLRPHGTHAELARTQSAPASCPTVSVKRDCLWWSALWMRSDLARAPATPKLHGRRHGDRPPASWPGGHAAPILSIIRARRDRPSSGRGPYRTVDDEDAVFSTSLSTRLQSRARFKRVARARQTPASARMKAPTREARAGIASRPGAEI